MRNFGSKDKQLSSLDTTPRIERTAHSGASQLEIPLQREVVANAGQIGRPQTVQLAATGLEVAAIAGALSVGTASMAYGVAKKQGHWIRLGTSALLVGVGALGLVTGFGIPAAIVFLGGATLGISEGLNGGPGR